MVLTVELPKELASRMEAASFATGLGAEKLLVLALAEKLARIDHERWLLDAVAGPANPPGDPA